MNSFSTISFISGLEKPSLASSSILSFNPSGYFLFLLWTRLYSHEICEQSGIKYDYLDKIFNGLKWAHVSCEYNLVFKRKRKYPEGLKERIEELANEGYSNPEIKDIVEKEFNITLTSSYVKDAKRNRRKG